MILLHQKWYYEDEEFTEIYINEESIIYFKPPDPNAEYKHTVIGCSDGTTFCVSETIEEILLKLDGRGL